MALITSAATSLKNTWGFSPQSIPGLALWLDAADTTSITGTSTVTAWRDKSGNGNNATATGSPALTQNAINGVQAISTAVGTYFRGSVPISGTTLTCFAVATTNVTLPNLRTPRRDQRLVSLANGTNTDYSANGVIALFNQDNTSTIAAFDYPTFQGRPSNPIVKDIPFLAVSHFNGTTASLWLNGSAGTVPTTAYSTSFSITKYGIGEQAGIVSPINENWSGFFGEIILFSTALTTSQRQQVEGYLAAKWGLKANLPATHPYSTGSIIPFNRPFYPTDIGGCSLWLDGADQSSMTFSSGSSVSSWNDKSGNGYNFTNNGGSTNPTTDPTMGLLFTTMRSFANSSVPIPSNYTLFLVGNLTSIPSSYGRMINMNTTTDGFGFLGTFNNSFNFATFTGSGGGTWYDTNANTPTYTVASSPNLSIMAMTISGTSLTPFFNGTILNSKTNSGSTASTTGMCLNGISFAGQGVNAHFAEVLLFNSPLSTSQRQQVEQYLAWKWGLVANLPLGHPGKLLPAFGTVSGPGSVAYLVVGGGGGGASRFGGGGGAGGFLTGVLTVLVSTSYTVTVGSGGTGGPGSGGAGTGGAGFGGQGNSSVFSSITALGGGGGGPGDTFSGLSGASGGGGAGRANGDPAAAPYYGSQTSGGLGTSGQGNNGSGAVTTSFRGGGGGGAGAVGTNPNGGAGKTSSITGTLVTYAGGGGGGGSADDRYSLQNGGEGGAGGGGAGGPYAGGFATEGTPNTGGGGGGGAYNGDFSGGSQPGANGGSGVVILAYPSTYSPLSYIDAGLTYEMYNNIGKNIIYIFKSGTGTIQWKW
jgi:hypothetical protein